MIFSKRSQNILNEWRLDFEAAPQQPSDANLLPAINAGRRGDELKTLYISSIASLAFTNLTVPGAPDLQIEAKTILDEIKQHYNVESVGGYLKIEKKNE